MIEFQNKKKLKRFIYSPLTLVFLFVVFIFIVKGVWDVYQKESISRKNLEVQKVKLDKLSTRSNDLAQSIDYMKTDEGVEAELRSKFRFVKEEESVAVILDDGASSSVTQSGTASSTFQKTSFFGKILGIFGIR